jgi:hypothetical protein
MVTSVLNDAGRVFPPDHPPDYEALADAGVLLPDMC